MKLAAATAALPYLVPEAVLGVGSGRTVNAFISLLAPLRHQIKGRSPRPRHQRLRFTMSELLF